MKWIALAFGVLTSIATGQDERAYWWSLRPLEQPELPPGTAAHPIDRFVDQALELRGLEPNPSADRRTLIRRMSFDLLGLPPSPRDIEAFASPGSAMTHGRLIDRLLTSPQYGERWARHWLDVAHFGETHGYDKDKLRAHAWPYRDYVIRALNDDAPYQRFVTEQVAGDLLRDARRPEDGIVATGFLTAGPWDFVGHVELREGTVDKKKARNIDRDDFVANVMTTFTSTTAHCARCHDHKFDPISQRDYYRLQAVFAGIDRADRPYWTSTELRRRDELEAERAQRHAAVAAYEAERERIAAPIIDDYRTAAPPDDEVDGWPPVPPARPAYGLGYHSKIERNSDVEKWIEIELAEPATIDEVILVPTWERYGGHPGPGFGFPRRFKIEAFGPSGAASVSRTSRGNYPHPGDAPVSYALDGFEAQRIRITATHLWERTDDWCFALAEVLVFDGDRNVARGAEVRTLDSIEAGDRWGARFLVDGRDSRVELDATAMAALLEAARLESRRRSLRRDRDDRIRQQLALQEIREPTAAIRRLEQIDAELRRLRRPRLVYAATTAFEPQGNFRPAPEPRPIHVLARGSVESPGELVAPGALSSLPHLAHHFAELTPHSPDSQRRLALAAWLADRDNPLTWRSIVNRVWQHHFGRGLCASPNDFGRMGATPTHPALLDWLAVWFRDEARGSLKQLHRLIMTSEAYRRAATANPANERLDPSNDWLWRANRRRLEAEALRDATLAVAGRLDPTMGGPSVRQFGFEDDHSPRYLYEAFDVDSPAARRRSIYRLTVRSVPDPWFECLDCADPSLSIAERPTTLTALQALTTWNNRFTLRMAQHFAQRVTSELPSRAADERVRRAVELAWGRPPSADEAPALESFAERHGFPALCRVLLNASEFLFVD